MLLTVILQQIMLLVKDYMWYRGRKHGGCAGSVPSRALGCVSNTPGFTCCLCLLLGPCPRAQSIQAGARGQPGLCRDEPCTERMPSTQSGPLQVGLHIKKKK